MVARRATASGAASSEPGKPVALPLGAERRRPSRSMTTAIAPTRVAEGRLGLDPDEGGVLGPCPDAPRHQTSRLRRCNVRGVPGADLRLLARFGSRGATFRSTDTSEGPKPPSAARVTLPRLRHQERAHD